MARARGEGSIYQQKTSAFWWIKYHRNGKTYRESTHETDEKKALNFLKKRLAEITTDTFIGPVAERVKVEELAEDFLRDYRINGKRTLLDAEARWKVHLEPFFGTLRAVQVTSDLLARYVDQRQQEKAKNATINREMAALKRMFYLAYRSTPPKVHRVPAFPRLAENNARRGFLSDAQYDKLAAACSELWLRSLLEMGRTYGWRKGELLAMRAKQIDLLGRTIRLEPGTTKNKEGREVVMTDAVYQFLSRCVAGKSGEDFVFTRANGRRVRNFRTAWAGACAEAGVPGLLFHDLRRTAARNLRRAGVAEGVIMKIGGWRTRSVFERYAIVAQSDIADAISRLESRDGHTFGHTDQQPAPPSENPTRPN